MWVVSLSSYCERLDCKSYYGFNAKETNKMTESLNIFNDFMERLRYSYNSDTILMLTNPVKFRKRLAKYPLTIC